MVPFPLLSEKVEELFLTVPNAKSALEASREFASRPHLAGSKEDFQDAKVILELFQKELMIGQPKESPIFEAGSWESRHSTLDLTGHSAPAHPRAWIDTYHPVLDTPLYRSLRLLSSNGSVLYEANLVEDGDPLDPDAAKYMDAVPTWHGSSFDGTATGQFVYANYGTQEDYLELVRKGVNLKGKIVIARYGDIIRGLKVKGAEELGAAGVVLYSDPRDDGYVTEENGYESYPQGPARNPTAVERGTVQYMSLYPGDPTTPGYPSYKNATRQKGTSIPSIPSLPISWNNAQLFLSKLGPAKYPSLDGKVSKDFIELVNHVDVKATPIWNTMAAIPGHINDEVVILGCHRDAWVLGAGDPVSGTVSLREIVRGYGALLRVGWKPLRTIIIASWDGEEYGLMGSTEWGEDFHPWISKHVVAYLNVDMSAFGSTWRVGGSPSLADVIKRTALDVPHPTKVGKTLWDARDDHGPFDGNKTDILGKKVVSYREIWAKLPAVPAAEFAIVPLGSGTDFTVFLQRIGVASTDQAFGSDGMDAVYHYHSVYDSQRWQELYGDPTFERHVAVAKHLGLLALRLADSILLPLNTTRYAFELDSYLDHVAGLPLPSDSSDLGALDFSDLKKSIKSLQNASLELDKEKAEAEKVFREHLDKPPRHLQDGTPHSPAPHHYIYCLYHGTVDFVRALVGIGPRFDQPEHLSMKLTTSEALALHHSHFPSLDFIKAAKRVARINKKLKFFETGFISEEGIKDREWYKHLGVAPGKWLGYGATTFPALSEAITIEKNRAQAVHEAERLKVMIDALAERTRPRKGESEDEE